MAFKRSGVRLPLSPPAKGTAKAVPFLLRGDKRTRGSVQDAGKQKNHRFSANAVSGAHLAQPIRSNAEDGVWVQTPRRASRGYLHQNKQIRTVSSRRNCSGLFVILIIHIDIEMPSLHKGTGALCYFSLFFLL